MTDTPQHRQPFANRGKWHVLALTLAVFLTACGGNETTDGGGEGGGDGNGDEPLYVMTVGTSTGASFASFALIIDSLEAGTEADFASAIELPNGGLAIGPPRGEVLYVLDGTTPVLTEFRLSSDGSFERGRRVSLAGLSVTTQRAAAGNFFFFSETKAYIFDTFTQIIIIWDPSTMTITGTVDLSPIGIQGEVALVGDQPLMRGDELVIALHYLGIGGQGRTGFGPESKLVFIDPATDTVNQVVSIPNCGTLGSTFLDERGDLYAASEFLGITTRVVGDRGGPECFVRVPAGTYDIEDYTLLTERTNGMAAGSLFQIRGTRVYVRVFDASLLPEFAPTPSDVSGATAWFWGELDLAAEQSVQLRADIPAGAAPTTGYTVDGETWITENAGGFSGSTLINIAEGDFRRGIFVPAVITNVFRLR